MSEKTDATLSDIEQALADMVVAVENNATGEQASAIEQALADVVVALEKMTAGGNTEAIVAAIKGLHMPINVSPTPVQFNVPPYPGFKPITLKVTGWHHTTGRIETVDIFEKV